MVPRTDPRTEVCWGISAAYRGRAHVVPVSRALGLCGMPIDTRFASGPRTR